MRVIAFLYGIAAYILFLAVFLYAIGFVGGIVVPKTVDTATQLPVVPAVIIDLLLLTLFAVQHSGMARRAFKRIWTKLVPWPVERTTYVMASNAVLALLMWQWQGFDQVIWWVGPPLFSAVLWIAFAFGWLLVLLSTFLVSHTDLFGLRQVYHFLHARELAPFEFKGGSLYSLVRHPLYLGFFIAFWATPHMTAGHLLFAAAATGYILVAIQLEERDLIHAFGDRYVEYRRRVPMLIPLGRRKPERAPSRDG
jgi:protein-S-isoprenylcysteine O-methyltransferase Ste14